MKNVLIFGGTGFLGNLLVPALAKSADFHPILPERALWDIADPGSLDAAIDAAKPDIVMNMAAISSTGASADDVYGVNAQGALNLMEALIRAGFQGRHIFFSSSNIYGAADSITAALDEETRPLPLNHYSCAKLLGEHYSAMYAMELDSTIVRPFSIIGAGQKPYFLLPKMARHYAQKLPTLELGNLDVAKDFVDARDLVSMLLCVLRAETAPPLVNLCNGDAVTLNALLEMFQDVSGHTPEISINPDFIRAKDIHYQRGNPARIRALGHERGFEIMETVRWIYDDALNNPA